MLTPIEINGKVFKSGIGYDKKDVESFIKKVSTDYEAMYKENVELNDKLNVLSEGIQYYKSIETTLQKALVLAEKTSEETQNSAKQKAELILQDANTKAKEITMNARMEMDRIRLEIANLAQQYEIMKASFKQVALTQLELMESEAFTLKVGNVTSEEETSMDHNDIPTEEVTEEKEAPLVIEHEDDFEFIDINE